MRSGLRRILPPCPTSAATTQGEVVSLHRHAEAGTSEFLPEDHADVRAFLGGGAPSSEQRRLCAARCRLRPRARGRDRHAGGQERHQHHRSAARGAGQAVLAQELPRATLAELAAPVRRHGRASAPSSTTPSSTTRWGETGPSEPVRAGERLSRAAGWPRGRAAVAVRLHRPVRPNEQRQGLAMLLPKDRGFVHRPSSEITPHSVFKGRRRLLAGLGAMAAVGAREASAQGRVKSAPLLRHAQRRGRCGHDGQADAGGIDATTYNNFYEFGTDKSDPAQRAHTLKTRPWTRGDRRRGEEARRRSASTSCSSSARWKSASIGCAASRAGRW